MPSPTEMMQMWAGFDPYGAVRAGELAPAQWDIKQMQTDLQKLQLQEQTKEVKADLAQQDLQSQVKAAQPTGDLGGGLQRQANQVVPADWKLKSDDGINTVAGDVNNYMVQSNTAAQDSEKDRKSTRLNSSH